jgi:phage baseplate assembly protein V
MRGKNILADTDYTKGHDNRFQNAVSIGYVSEVIVDDTQANVRVIFPDRVDHKGQPLITKPIPVLQIASQAKKSFAVPRKGDMVAVQKMANGTSSYLVTGSFYTTANPPPVTDPMLDHCVYDDGSTKEFNASNGTESWKLKGDVNWDNEGAFIVKLGKGMTITPQGDVLIDAPNIELKGALKFTGDITHQGNINTSGTHTDTRGLHTSGKGMEDLIARVEALERRVGELEARQL